MSAVTMHHFSGLAAPFVRSKGTVSGGVFNLAQIISEIVFYIEHKNVSSVEEALAILKENYNTYYDILKQDSLAIADVLPNGIVECV